MLPSSSGRHDTQSHGRSPSTKDQQTRDQGASASDGDRDHGAAPVDLMVVSRARRSNAGNRMSTLLAQSAQDPDEEWGEEWEDAPNEEEFVEDNVNEHDDYNLDSSSSDDDEDEGADDDAGEKELRKAERQERSKKRKVAANPFAARLAAASRKRVKLHLPSTESSASAPRPKKKSERASWIPTDEDGPTRTSSRRQTVANKQNTLAKLKEKDRRRDDTLAMMKAAEARKAKHEPKPLTQAERLAEAARVEKLNSKSLHRWEEEEEMRAAERQAKIDALKNRQIEGPFVRYYSGPAIWVDDKIKYTGKDAPSLESLEEKLNKDSPAPTAQEVQPNDSEQATRDPTSQPPADLDQDESSKPLLTTAASQNESSLHGDSHIALPTSGVSEQEATSTISQSIYPNTTLVAPPGTMDPFLFGMEQYAHSEPSQPEYGPFNFAPPPTTHAELPPNPFLFTSPFSQIHASLDDPTPSQDETVPPSYSHTTQFHQPSPAPPPPPKRKVISRALRNLLILCSFPNLEATAPISGRVRAAASLLKEKDRASLIQLSTSLFGWSLADATTFVNTMLNAPKTKKEKEAALAKPRKELCAVSNKEARYRDPETGIAYHDSRAFGVLRGVVGGGFVWCGEAGCYVGGRAKPMVGMGKGFLGMAPARGVPKRFLEMQTESSSSGDGASRKSPPSSSSEQSKVPPSSGAALETSQGAIAAPAASGASGTVAAVHPAHPAHPAAANVAGSSVERSRDASHHHQHTAPPPPPLPSSSTAPPPMHNPEVPVPTGTTTSIH